MTVPALLYPWGAQLQPLASAFLTEVLLSRVILAFWDWCLTPPP